jgi:hypothetical protein
MSAMLVLDKQITFDNFEWVSDCCFTPIQQFFSYIMARTS